VSVWTNWDPLEEVIVGDCYAPGDLDWCIPDIFQTMFVAGTNWISQPPPMLRDLRRNFEYQNLDPTANRGTMVYEKLYKNLLLRHTATMFKCGDRLITNTRGPGTQLGLEWMRKNLPAETVVPADNVLQNWGHVIMDFS
jgi:hypothetical protein